MTPPAGGAVYRRTSCRLCGGSRVAEVFALTPTPPANAFVREEDLGRPQDVYPLDVFFCSECTHVQLLDIVDPRVLFEDYVYVSGTSPSFVRHFEQYARDVAPYVKLDHDSLVVDIGSNDGTLLRQFKAMGARVLGIDPARSIAEAASANGTETRVAFFSADLAGELAAEVGMATVITANNVFAHIDDLPGIAEGIRRLLAPDGIFVFEVSYLLDVIQKVLFDTIYHEHLSYHAVFPLRRFFDAHGLELINVSRVSSHGGSLRGFVQHKNGPRAVDDSVSAALTEEAAAGLERAETYVSFSDRIESIGRELRGLLTRLKAGGASLAGFGAPAKATTLMYHFALGPQQLDFIIDDSPLKQGLFTPGLHVPVVDSSALIDRKPDYLLILAWNFAEPIIAKSGDFRNAGGKFIVPLPKLEVV
jgi:SAM-dependent methyltransferase